MHVIKYSVSLAIEPMSYGAPFNKREHIPFRKESDMTALFNTNN